MTYANRDLSLDFPARSAYNGSIHNPTLLYKENTVNYCPICGRGTTDYSKHRCNAGTIRAIDSAHNRSYDGNDFEELERAPSQVSESLRLHIGLALMEREHA